MTHTEPLTTDRLRRRCDVDDLPFEHTGELKPIEGFLGQDRAITALRFGVEIEHDSYHLFALGPTGLGKHAVVQRLLAERASQRETPNDWCYVHNFAEPHRPNAIALPVGRGLDLQHALEQLIDELQSALPAAFESDDYRTRRQAIEDAAQRQQEEAFEELQSEAKKKGVTLLRTPVGMALAPLRGEEVLKPDEFKQLSEDEQTRIKTDIEGLQEKLEGVMRQMPQWEREARNDVPRAEPRGHDVCRQTSDRRDSLSLQGPARRPSTSRRHRAPSDRHDRSRWRRQTQHDHGTDRPGPDRSRRSLSPLSRQPADRPKP